MSDIIFLKKKTMYKEIITIIILKIYRIFYKTMF